MLSYPQCLRQAVVLSVFLAAGVSCGFSDWPEFRGPRTDGHSEEALPTEWNESVGVRWKTEIPGLGWSSPVVSGDFVFLTTAVQESAEEDSPIQLKLLKLKAADGSLAAETVLFQHSEEDAEHHEKNSHASATPVIDDDRIFVHFGPHGTACLQTDGTVLWKNEELQYQPQHGNGGSPCLAEGMLVVCCDGRDSQTVVGMDAQTGRIVWKSERNTDATRGFSFCTPTAVTVNGAVQVVCPGSGAVCAYEPRTGRELWRVDYDQGYSVVPRPVYGNGLVYVCSGFTDKTLYAVDPTGQGDITDTHIRWKTRSGVPMSPSLMLIDDRVYFVSDNGVLRCLNAVTGDVVWTSRLDGGFSASPTFDGTHLFFTNEIGITTVIRHADSFEKVAENVVGDGKTRTFASFAVTEGDILLRSETHLYRITR